MKPDNEESLIIVGSDGVFKEITLEQAQELGLISIGGELPLRQSTRSDLVFRKPPHLNLAGTLFHFFLLITVIEFKSEHDPFNVREFYKNVMRVYAIHEQDPKLKLHDILNLFVLARTPHQFFKQGERHGHLFKPVDGQDWIRQGVFGDQRVLFVLCDQLPLEEQYYPWLLFASSKKQLWQDFIKQLIKSGKYPELLKVAREMRPKEFEMVLKSYGRRVPISELDPREVERIRRERKEANQILAETLGMLPDEELKEVLYGLKPEERLSGLKPEERLSGLSEAERAQMLKLLLGQDNPQK